MFQKHDKKRNACQLHRFFGWKEAKVSYGVPYRVKAGDCYAALGELHCIMTENSSTVYMQSISGVNTGSMMQTGHIEDDKNKLIFL